jgi:ABC-type amino acid transport substrate-binding protein
MKMKWNVAMLAAFFIFAAGGSRAVYAAPPTDACALLTPAQVSAVLDLKVGAGTSLPGNSKLCHWGAAVVMAKGTTKKGVMLTLQSPMAFAYAKMPVGNGIIKVPVSGIGDDAVYGTTPGYPTVLTVKKGNVVFVVHVNGFPDDQIKAKEKMLALDVVAKL